MPSIHRDIVCNQQSNKYGQLQCVLERDIVGQLNGIGHSIKHDLEHRVRLGHLHWVLVIVVYGFTFGHINGNFDRVFLWLVNTYIITVNVSVSDDVFVCVYD